MPSLDSFILFFVTVVVSILITMVAAYFWPEWKNYIAGSVIGLGIGAALIAFVVYAYSQLFFSPTGYFKNPIPPQFIPLIFVWTFATEIPFILLVGIPVIKACYKAFPTLKSLQEPKTKEK